MTRMVNYCMDKKRALFWIEVGHPRSPEHSRSVHNGSHNPTKKIQPGTRAPHYSTRELGRLRDDAAGIYLRAMLATRPKSRATLTKFSSSFKHGDHLRTDAQRECLGQRNLSSKRGRARRERGNRASEVSVN